MKALTVWQPWASLIVLGLKPYEFRPWAYKPNMVGTRVAIHAGARRVPAREFSTLKLLILRGAGPRMGLTGDVDDFFMALQDQCANLTHGAVIGFATLGEPVPSSATGFRPDSNRPEKSGFGWPMLDPKPLDIPEDARGQQGFWNWGGTEP